MSRLPRSGGATAAGWGCLPSLFGGCGVAGSAFSPKAELTRSTSGGFGCSLVSLWLDHSGTVCPGRLAACSAYYDLGGKFAPMAAPLLSPSPSSPPLDSLTGSLRALGLGWIGSAARSPAGGVVGLLAGAGGWWCGWVGLLRLWRRLACSAPAPSFLLSCWPASLPVRARAAPRCRLALLLLACGVALPSQVGRLGAGLV